MFVWYSSAAQTHKVPRKSLRNWMKRCHIKSSFPMPQQLKQFVENSKKQKEYKNFDYGNTEAQNYEKSGTETEAFEPEIDFGKHFLTFSNLSSEDEEKAPQKEDEEKVEDGNTALNMSLHE